LNTHLVCCLADGARDGRIQVSRTLSLLATHTVCVFSVDWGLSSSSGKTHPVAAARLGVPASRGIITGMGGCLEPTYFGDDPPTGLGGTGTVAEPHNGVMRCHGLLAAGGDRRLCGVRRLRVRVCVGVAACVCACACACSCSGLCVRVRVRLPWRRSPWAAPCSTLACGRVICVYGRAAARTSTYIMCGAA